MTENKDHEPAGLDNGFDPKVYPEIWFEQALQQHITPAIRGLKIRHVPLGEGFVAVVIGMLASAAVDSNKKTVVYYELPPTDIRRPPLAAVRNGHLATFPDADTRAAAGRRKWIGIGGARLSLVCFVPHNWPRRQSETRKLVGVAGFEPATPSSRTRCATRRRYTLISLVEA